MSTFKPSFGFRHLAKILVMTSISMVSGLASAAPWPDHPITLVVPFAPGGSADGLGRILAEKMGQKLNQTIIVENRPGAATTIASSYVARAKPDGYTLYIGMMNLHGMDKVLYPGVAYDGIKSFSHINKLVTFPMVVVAANSSPIKSFADLIAKAKAEPGRVTHGSAGVGSSNHLAAVEFMRAANVKLLNVPYKGGNPAAMATIAGDVDISFATPPTVMPLVTAGRIKALGLTSAAPSALFPGIPSSAEAGLPGYDFVVWHGLYGPAGMDPKIVEQLYEVSTAVLKDPEVKEKLGTLGMEAQPSTSVDAFNQFVRGVAKDTEGLAAAAKADEQ
ncbi:Bug family tripartite tricarboxylate transporter substrate binding protein [Bordetella genomosp. 12]|uniref:ABC transporter substrate-binding protein n=1 Tax=Bordetella genomosp. 12 TaxID=463035 RepID=A0A261VCE6_9BORD|nr:tripartite tricarboxylate transporter substrate binding protein [Bordetella genomosp. 12]OZI71818.1 hypothetical protein CAL22_18675 [Bordetella genomosp. 12]